MITECKNCKGPVTLDDGYVNCENCGTFVIAGDVWEPIEEIGVPPAPKPKPKPAPAPEPEKKAEPAPAAAHPEPKAKKGGGVAVIMAAVAVVCLILSQLKGIKCLIKPKKTEPQATKNHQFPKLRQE